MCRQSIIIQYYEYLHCHHKEFNIRDRERRIMSSQASMPSYYRSLIDVSKICNIYQSFLDDRKRCIISRWRLSCHRLFIETGRYTSPPTPRENRKCRLCNVLEDEYHAIFICPYYIVIRIKFAELLQKYNSIRSILDPDQRDANQIAIFLDIINSMLEKRITST